MPEVVLRDYLEQVAGLIDEGQPGDAVRHCRNVLDQFPRHVDTYRLLGKALLELRQYDDAGDIFQRILSADPGDFIAHAGMAILHQEQDRLDEAIWHMERAFEADPYNVAIRDALNDLYGRRDGSPAASLMLTRGALARFYVQGGLYSLAIAELHELLAGDAERIDLQVLLAEALWRDGQRVDAVDVCTRIVERLPDCIVANAVLAEVWFMAGRTDEAQERLRRIYRMVLPSAERLHEDDPLASAFRVKEAFSVPAEIMVEPLPERAAAGRLDEMSEWLKGVDLDEDVDLEGAEPEWLEALQGDEEALSGVEDDAVADWLRQVAAQSPGESDQPQLPPEAAEVAAEMSSEAEDDTRAGRPAPSPESDEEEVAAWSEEPERRGEPGAEGAAEWPDHASDQLPGIGELSEETDWEDWLEHEREAGTPESSAESRPERSVFEEVGMGANDERDQFQEQVPEDRDSGAPEKEQADQSSAEPDWLEEFEAASSESPQPSDRPAKDDKSLPDWLREDASILDESGDALTWLDDDEGDQDAADEDETPEKELPDWLDEGADETVDESVDDVEDELSWLDQIAAGEGAPIEEPPTMSWPESEAESAGAERAAPADDVSEEAHQASHTGQEADETISESEEQAQEWADDLMPGEGESIGSEETIGSAGEVSIDEVPEDLDDAMEWMEQLAAQEGEPFPEMPPMDELSEEDEETLLEEMPDDLDEAMTWLSDLAEDEPAEQPTLPVDEATAESAEGSEGEEAADWLAAFVDEEEEEPGVEEVEESLAFASDDVQESDDQALEQIEVDAGAEGPDDDILIGLEEAPPEELEEAVSEDEVSEEEVPEDLDDAMAWLEQLAAKQGASLDELPSLRQADAELQADEPSGEAEAEEPLEAELDWIEAMGDEGDLWEERPDEAPDDLAELPAEEFEGLEEWSEPEEAAIDELPTEAEEPLEADLDWMDAIGDEGELEDKWLDDVSDDLADRPAIEEEEVEEWSEPEESAEDVDEAMRWLDELAELPTTPRSELSALEDALESEDWPEQDLEDLDEIPEDPDAALAWLESLARGDVTADQDVDSVEEQPTPPVPHDVVEARAEAEAIILQDRQEFGLEEDEEILGEMPEDPDEAMDWLERLAARQGASLDELPSVESVEDEVETPQWISQEIEQEGDEPEESAAFVEAEEISDEAEELADELDTAAEADRLATDEGEEVADVLAEEGLIDEEEFLADLDLGDEDLDDALPNWLDIDDEAALDEFEWDEVSGDVTGWLEAEDEATQHDMEVPDTVQPPVDASEQPDVMMEDEADVETVMEPEEVEAPPREEEPAPAEPDVPPVSVSEGLDDKELQAARQAMDAGDSESALNAYRELIKAGQDLSLLIGELESVSEQHPGQPQLLRLLGDAYMENGQLQRALDAYRSALDTI